ncbi:MAG: EamA family transporter, partial [Bacteroidetes bacterium HGW-Bacteroidetes-23]
MQNDNVKSYLHLHLIVFIWGFTAILGELISLDALPLVWFRMLMAVGFIVLFMLYKKTDLTIPRKTIMVFLFLGLVIALHWLTFFKAIKVSNVSVTLACLSTGAFFTSFLEPILYKRKVIWYEVFFGLLVVVGLYIIFNFEGDYYLGIILALTSAFLSALFSVINGKYAKMYDSTVISFYELSGGVLCFSVYLLFTNSFSKEFFILQPSDW